MKQKKQNKYPKEWVYKKTKSLKPIRNEKGIMLYSDAMPYLARVVPQDNPMFEFIFSLASFAMKKRLTDKQAEKCAEIIRYFEREGVL